MNQFDSWRLYVCVAHRFQALNADGRLLNECRRAMKQHITGDVWAQVLTVSNKVSAVVWRGVQNRVLAHMQQEGLHGGGTAMVGRLGLTTYIEAELLIEQGIWPSIWDECWEYVSEWVKDQTQDNVERPVWRCVRSAGDILRQGVERHVEDAYKHNAG